MTGSSTSLTRRPEWAALQEHYQKIREVHLRQLFAGDPKRGERLTAEAVGLYFDYSKHRITARPSASSCSLPRRAAFASASRPCSAAIRST